MSSSEYKPPDYWNFPPLFTIQPVAETRRKQLELWRQLIVNYHSHHNLFKMNISSFPLFTNSEINRSLSEQSKTAVLDHLISSGNAEWEDVSKTILNIFYKSPDDIAESAYAWAQRQGFMDMVFTIFELYAGEEHLELGLVGMDPSLIRKALAILEKKGKCLIIYGSSPEEDGVKFLAAA